MIEVHDLSVAFGAFTLSDVNITLSEGQSLAILGPSGAGKTLLLETVMGARRPRAGRVLLDGRDITTQPAEHRRIAYIPQDLALFPHLTVRENVVFGLATAHDRRAGMGLDEIAAMLRIGHLLDRRDVRTLSGGERQRVALARALIVRPRVLFLDEPFSALDASTRGELLVAFRAMHRQLGATIFMVTHDLEEAAFLADHIALMMAGRLIQQGPADQMLRRPRTVAAARFLNFRNILPGAAIGHPGGGVVAVHAEAIRLEPTPTGGLRGRLTSLVPVNQRLLAEVALDSGHRLEASLPRTEEASLQPAFNATVGVQFADHAVVPLDG